MKLKKLSLLMLSVSGIAYSSTGIADTALPATITPKTIPDFQFSDKSLLIEQIKSGGGYKNANSDVLKAIEANKGVTIKGSTFLTDINMAYPSSVKPTVNFIDNTHLIGTTLNHAAFRLGDSYRGTAFDDSSVINITLKGIDESNTGNLQLHNGTKAYNTTVDAWGVMELRTASDKEKVQAHNTLVKTNGKLTVGYNAYAENNLIDGGELYIPIGANGAITENTIIRNGGTYTLDAGTAINNYITGAGSYQAVSGLALNNYIYDGGYQSVYVTDRTGAKNTTIYQGGTQRVRSGTVEDSQVYGDQIITNHSGDWENGQWVSDNDPDETWGNDPTAKNTQVMAGGTQIVGLNGKAEETTIYQDGIQFVQKRAEVATTLVDGGIQYVQEYGGTEGTIIRNGGKTFLDYGAYSFYNLDVENGSLIMEGGDAHPWLSNFGKGAYAQNVNLAGENAYLYIRYNKNTPESVATIGKLVNNGVTVFGDLNGDNIGRNSQLTIGELSGKGIFVMNTSLADSKGDFLNVTDSVSGNHGVRVMDSGNALVSNTTDPYRYHLIHAAGSQNDTFALTNKSVDLGAWKYYLVQDKDKADEWYLSPIKETKPVDPVDPVDPVKPVDPVDPVDPVKPVDPVDPVDPVKPVDPVDPVDPVKPVDPVDPVDPVKPVDPVDPVKPVDPVDPVKPVDPIRPETSDPAKTALMIANAIPTIWKGELSTLRARLGELRNDSQVNLGAWSKVTAARHNINNNEVAYRHDMNGIVAGGDKMTEFENGKLWTGVLVGYSSSSLSMAKNDGKIDSYSLGIYSTFRHNSGVYVDGVVKANHFRSTYDARFNDGKTSANSNTNGLGFSVETGKYFEKNNYFIEPYAMVSAFQGQGADYHYSNGMNIKADGAKSFSGEMGATLGKNFALENGAQIKPYIRLAVNHEFAKNGDVEFNKEGKRTNDMSGTTGKYGVGINAKLNDKWAIYGEFNYAKSSTQETPYSGLIGVNYRF